MRHRLKTAFKLAIIAVLWSLIIWPSGMAWVELTVLHMKLGAGAYLPWTAWGRIFSSPRFRTAWEALSALSVAGMIYFGFWLSRDVDGVSTAGKGAYGSAKWRHPSSYTKTLARWAAGRQHDAAGLVVGVADTAKRVRSAWVMHRDDHAILLGAPGAGKSTFVIMPTLGVLGESGDTVMITDPKGELYEASAGLFRRAGYNLIRLDLREPEFSARWNPLTQVALKLKAGRHAEAARAARDLSQVLAAQGTPNGENGQFWQQSTVSLLTALCLAVADRASEPERHLASVYHTLISTKDLDAFFDGFPPEHPAAQAYGPVRMSKEETRANQLTVAATALQIFADPSVSWLTSGDEIDLARLASPGCAVFVVVPDESSSYYGLASLFVQQVTLALSAAAARRPGQRLEKPVHLLLDEFGNLPRLPEFEKTLAVGRGKGIRITLALQALSQLDDRYGEKTARTMRNACNTWIYLSSNDVDTAELVSQKTGQGTVGTASRSRTRYAPQGGDQETFGETGRRLLTMDEVLRWPMGEALLLQSGQFPAKLPLRRFDAWPFSFGSPPNLEPREIESPKLWSSGKGKTPAHVVDL